jgi:hypothetical protein
VDGWKSCTKELKKKRVKKKKKVFILKYTRCQVVMFACENILIMPAKSKCTHFLALTLTEKKPAKKCFFEFFLMSHENMKIFSYSI